MKTLNNSLLITLAMVAVACSPNAEINETSPQTSVLEAMVSVVTPATDIIWDAYELETDAQWLAVDQAAVTTIRAFEEIKVGGSGTNDDQWASEAEWDSLSNEVISAAELVRNAVQKRDEDLLAEAGDLLYPPCESCHTKYQPGGTVQ